MFGGVGQLSQLFSPWPRNTGKDIWCLFSFSKLKSFAGKHQKSGKAKFHTVAKHKKHQRASSLPTVPNLKVFSKTEISGSAHLHCSQLNEFNRLLKASRQTSTRKQQLESLQQSIFRFSFITNNTTTKEWQQAIGLVIPTCCVTSLRRLGGCAETRKKEESD